MSDPLIWFALAACLLGSYFAACHHALKTFSRGRFLELLEERGRPERFEPFVQRRSRLLLITGAVRTSLSLAVLLLTLSVVERRYPELGWLLRDIVAFLIAGLSVSVFMVAIPLSVASYRRESLLAGSIGFLECCLVIFWPLTVFLRLFDPVVRRVLGGGDSDTHLSDQILSVVEEHDNHGAVDEGQKEMIEAVVEFPTTTVGQIMTPRTDVQGIEVHQSLDEVRAAVLHDGHSRIPVYEDSLDHIVGILYTKDLIAYLGKDNPFELRNILRDVLMVPESKSVRELLAEFKTRKVHLAIVLDEYGGTAGLITIEDILEEIVGEIEDEYEVPQDRPPIRRLDDKTVEVDARVYIDDLNDELDLQLPESKDYDTVGGFVLSMLGHIPEVGEAFEFEGVQLTVTAAERTKVTRVRLEMAQQGATESS